MAKKQTVMFTALPNGLVKDSGGRKLKLSIFVSPRLEDDVSPGRLDHFPDFSASPGVNWASKVNTMSFRVEVMNNLDPQLPDVPTVIGTYRPVSKASPEVWDLMFKPETALAFKRQAIPAQMKVNTFSVAAVIKQVQDHYIAVGSTPSLVAKLPLVDKLVLPAGLKTSPMMRILPAIQRPPTIRVSAQSAAGDPVFKEFESFHKPFDSTPEEGSIGAQAAPGPGDVAARPTARRPKMDFHTALSSLGEFPGLVAGLGIVINLEIPYDDRLRALGKRVRVVPVAPIEGSASPWTAYDLAGGTKTVLGYSSAKSFATRPRTPREIRDGYMVMRTPANPSANPVTIVTVDPDFAGLAMRATADSASRQIKDVLAAQKLVGQSTKAQALTPGVIADVMRPVAGTISPSTKYEPMGLPGLGPSTLSVAINGRAAKLKSMVSELAKKDDRLAANEDKLILNFAEDVHRGYAIDVWDSITRRWHPLCARKGEYKIGGATIRFKNGIATLAVDGSATLVDEGWIQTAVVSDPNKTKEGEIPQEVWLHEHLFDWSGWSLVVQRPGAAMLSADKDGNAPLVRDSVGPDNTTHEIGQWVDPKFPLYTMFTVPEGSLPRKRFGTTYRFRGRSVDLAGHAVLFDATKDPGGAGDTIPTVSNQVVNRRTDPVKAPVVVITQPMKKGESPAILVVRSNYNTPPADIPPTSRHITPPRSSVEMAEELGGLDDALKPGKPMDTTLYSMLSQRDEFEFEPEVASEGGPKKATALALGPSGPQTAINPPLPPLLPGQLRSKPTYVPKEYTQQKPTERIENPDGTLPYLPDMLCRGATLKGLPGTPSTASGVRMSAAAAASPALGSVAKVGVVKIPTGLTTTETVKTIMVDFDQAGQKWYNKRSFKLVIKGIEATDTRVTPHATPKAPKWDATARTLTVELPKADKVKIELSSFMNPADLNLMEVYEWGTRPFVQKTTVSRLIAMRKMSLPTATPLPTLIKATMPTDLRALIGASLIGRNWTVTPHDTLTLVHAVQQPVIEPKFTVNARVSRKQGETHGILLDWMPVHGKSTAKVEVEAEWYENVDDPSAGAPKWKDPDGTDTSVAHTEKVFNVTVGPADVTVLHVGYKPYAKPTYSVISAMADDPKSNAQRHFFGDTHHRHIKYKATATSRFPEFFADNPNAEFTRTSPQAPIHVPSSARPAPPVISYVIPTYKFNKTASSSTRLAGGLRVYLERPWFSSGDNEQLAVILTPPSRPSQTRYHTQWGEDPIWASAGTLSGTRPGTSTFQGRAGSGGGMRLAEDGGAVSIAAYNVDFDAERDMWYADMRISPGGAYFPFVKMVLARFQPYSLPGLELSRVAFADFAQLSPERSASIRWSTTVAGVKQLTLSVTGHSYSDSHLSKFHGTNRATVTAHFERQLDTQSLSDNNPSGWLPVGTEYVLTRQPVSAAAAFLGYTAYTWKSTMPYPTTPGTYRLVINEYERHHSADSSGGYNRLVYADVLGPLTPPPLTNIPPIVGLDD